MMCRRSVKWVGLRVELLFLHIERKQLGMFLPLVRLPFWRSVSDVSNSKRPWGRSGLAGEIISLGWFGGHFVIPLEEMQQVAVNLCSDCCPCDVMLDKWQKMHVWMYDF